MHADLVVLAEVNPDPTWQRALGVAPAVLWPLIVILALVLFYRQIIDKLGDMTSLKVAKFEAEFADRLAGAQQQNSSATPTEERGAIGRAVRARKSCEGKRILWVDDEPGNNQQLGEVFKQLLGVSIDYTLTTDDGMRALLTNSDYAMVITDMRRGDHSQAGMELIRSMRERNVYRPTVIYSSLDSSEVGVPAGAFGLTRRADQLLHYVIDICERSE